MHRGPGERSDRVWRLNDAPGSATAHDSSGWENNGTLVGLDAATVWVADGRIGGALSVQGNGYVNVPDSASIDSVTDQVTVAAWMFLTAPVTSGSYATAISRQIGTGYGQHYHLSVNDQNQAILFITTTTAGQQVIGGPPTFPQQTWVHLAGTYDGSQIRLYVNGAQVNSQAVTGSFAAETNPVILSGNGNAASHTVSEFVPGQLDEVMLYRRALGADEIAELAPGRRSPRGRLTRTADREGGAPSRGRGPVPLSLSEQLHSFRARIRRRGEPLDGKAPRGRRPRRCAPSPAGAASARPWRRGAFVSRRSPRSWRRTSTR